MPAWLGRLRGWMQGRAGAAPAPAPADGATPAPAALHADGQPDLPINAVLLPDESGLPDLDWPRVQAWIDGIAGPEARSAARDAAELAWLQHLRQALGEGYRLQVQDRIALLSTLEPAVARATLDFVQRTGQRIVRVLDGVAAAVDGGHDILIVFDDEETYYAYVARFYGADGGEFAFSGGMFIDAGCGHFVTRRAELQAVEPVIAHEMTHACLGHLPLPAWLNEGLAVNTEQRLCPPPRPALSPLQMHARHRAFWGADEIQQFWCGRSFLRSDEGNELSYDLARILVAQFGADWARFRAFALAAQAADAGQAAAQEHLGLDLGAAVCALLENASDPDWSPRPECWLGTPERGAFAPRMRR